MRAIERALSNARVDMTILLGVPFMLLNTPNITCWQR